MISWLFLKRGFAPQLCLTISQLNHSWTLSVVDTKRHEGTNKSRTFVPTIYWFKYIIVRSHMIIVRGKNRAVRDES